MAKLKILTFIPIFIIGIVLLVFVFDSAKQLQALKTLQKNTYKIKNISQFIMDLQQERGLSSGYLGSEGKRFTLQLKKIRRKVDRGNRLFSGNVKLSGMRQKIDRLEVPTIQAFSFYTNIIKGMQKYYLEASIHIDDVHLLKQLHVYINLSSMQEALGRIRGSFNGVFSRKNVLDKALLYNAFHAKGAYDFSKDRFEATSSKKELGIFRKITETTEYKNMENIVKKYALLQLGNATEDPQKWFRVATNIINKIIIIEESLMGEIESYIEHKVHTTKLQISEQIAFFLFILFFSSWLGYKLKNDILRNIALLQEYKDAVDRSSIVSKTDKKGKITYANDKFCAISGYSREELVGKAHNIVRHPDMPKSAFKDMWDTILGKKPWVGIVKNRKKGGDSYTVEATINPILNHKGEIEEFIAIRNDITDIITLHDDLEHTQEELIFKLGEIGERRSHETGFHVKRVALYSQLLAKIYGLKEEEIKYLTTASPMHDIGKVGIPDEILRAPLIIPSKLPHIQHFLF